MERASIQKPSRSRKLPETLQNIICDILPFYPQALQYDIMSKSIGVGSLGLAIRLTYFGQEQFKSEDCVHLGSAHVAPFL